VKGARLSSRFRLDFYAMDLAAAVEFDREAAIHGREVSPTII
jgi:hypothetical protein